MSVLLNRRNTGDLAVLIKAKELAIHSAKSVQNEKYFPKKHRFTIVTKIVDYAFDIFISLSMAFDTENKDKKVELLQESMAKCKTLASVLDICQEAFDIPASKIVYWGNIAIETMELINICYKKEITV